MYAMATSRVTVSRGTATDDFGDTVAAPVTVYQGAASITESSNRYSDQATPAPRTVRSMEMLVSSSADVRSQDFVHDDTWGVSYVVMDVVQSRGPLFLPDKVCNLKRVD